MGPKCTPKRTYLDGVSIQQPRPLVRYFPNFIHASMHRRPQLSTYGHTATPQHTTAHPAARDNTP